MPDDTTPQDPIIKLILKAVAFGVALLGAYFGYLKNCAPPADEQGFAIGGIVFIAAAIYLLFMAVDNNFAKNVEKLPKIYLGTAVFGFFLFVCCLLYYQYQYNERTLVWHSEPPVRITIGNTLTQKAKNHLEKNPDNTKEKLLGDVSNANAPERVWTLESINESKTLLTCMYFMMVATIEITLLATVYVILPKADRTG